MDYNDIYAQKDFYWGLKPHPLVKESILYLESKARVLDLGCGEGKDALFLAKNNCDVTAVDISQNGIDKLVKYAQENTLNLKAYVSSIEFYLEKEIKNNDQYDAIYAMNSLQFLNQDTIFTVIKSIQEKTKRGGLNVIASFLAENKEQKDRILSKGRYFFDENELFEMYKEWEILFYEEKLGDWETHGQPRHRHYMVKLIALK